MPPATAGPAAIIPGEIRPASPRPHWARVATRLNAPQTTRYPTVTRLAIRSGRPSRPLRRWRAAARRTSGAVLGTIIAVIMIHHMRKIRVAWDADHAAAVVATEPIVSCTA